MLSDRIHDNQQEPKQILDDSDDLIINCDERKNLSTNAYIMTIYIFRHLMHAIIHHIHKERHFFFANSHYYRKNIAQHLTRHNKMIVSSQTKLRIIKCYWFMSTKSMFWVKKTIKICHFLYQILVFIEFYCRKILNF